MDLKNKIAWLFLFFMAPRAMAVSITPSLQSFDIQPGDAVEAEVSIQNTEGEDITVIPTTKNWFLLPANKHFKVEDWLIIKSESFMLKAGESKKLKFIARAPKKSEGELVGMLSFRTKSPTRTSVEFVMSAAVYVVVKGTEKFEGDVRAMMVTPSTGSVMAGILLRNTGNVHLRPSGIFQIYDGADQLIANVELERGQPTYPGQQRPYYGTVKDLQMSPGKYEARIELLDMDRQRLIDTKRQKFVFTKERKIEF